MLGIDDVNYEVIRTSCECKRNWLKMTDENSRFSKGTCWIWESEAPHEVPQWVDRCRGIHTVNIFFNWK